MAKSKPRFRVGQRVAIAVVPPKYGLVDYIEENAKWFGGFRYHLAGDPDDSPQGRLGYAGMMLRPVKSRPARRRSGKT